MALAPLSNDEWVNDVTTHLAKSGAALRDKANDRLSQLGPLVPRSFKGVPVEYDINYETTGNVIRGYKMTDMLTTCLWTAVCMSFRCYQSMTQVVEKGATDEGREVMAQVAANSTDKYRARPNDKTYDSLIVLPGSNLIGKGALNMDMIHKLVKEEGAYIKPHPITNRLDLYQLTKRFGDRVLPQRNPLHPLLRGASRIWGNANSESGLAAIMYGKQFTLIDKLGPEHHPTYIAFFQAFANAAVDMSDQEKLAALFSHPESGLVSVFHKNPEERIAAFFAQYDHIRHGR